MPQDRKKTDIPSTIERSDGHAEHIWKKTHDSAVETYGEGQRAHRTAFASLKHSYEKVGDHWEQKDQKGPSDERASKSTSEAARNDGDTAGGVDANASVGHLRDVARKLDIEGRSKMGKDDLVKAIDKENRKATAKARRG